MNDRHDASEEFSLERQRRAGRVSAREKGEDEIATAPKKPSSPEVTDSAFPDRIRRKYYVVASESEKDGSDARLYADENFPQGKCSGADVCEIAGAWTTLLVAQAPYYRQTQRCSSGR